jgi:hypothetical protein
MKINEIATNEGLEKILPRIFGNGAKVAKSAGRMEPGFGPLPSAANAGQAELGGIKATDNLLTPAEHSALFPQTTTGTTGAKPKPRADTSAYDREVRNAHDMNPGMPNKGKPSSEAEKYLELKQAQAARTAAEKQAAADDLARQVSPADDLSKEIKPGADTPKTSGGRREPSMGSAASPADDWTKKVGSRTSEKPPARQTSGDRLEPGIDAPAASTAADAPRYTMDEYRRFQELLSTNPAAAQAAQAAEKEVAKKSGMGPWSKAAAGTLGATIAYELGSGAYNKFKPEAWPAAPGAPQGSLNLDTPPVTPPPQDWKPSGVTNQPSAAPAASTNDPTEEELQKAREADPEWQELHKKDKVNESTNELNRMVYLSRL